jgi:hypothetical protein
LLLVLAAAALLTACSQEGTDGISGSPSPSELPSPGATLITTVPEGSGVTLLNGLSLSVPKGAKARLLRTGSPGLGVAPEWLEISWQDRSSRRRSVGAYSDPSRGDVLPSMAALKKWRLLARDEDGTEVRWTGSKTGLLWVAVVTKLPGQRPGMVSAVWRLKREPERADAQSLVEEIWRTFRIQGAGAFLVQPTDGSPAAGY